MQAPTHAQFSLYINFVQKWLAENNIGKTNEKRKSIARDILYSCIFDSGLNIDDIRNIKQFIHENTFDMFHGNLFNNINTYFKTDKYNKFWRNVFELKPDGLSTSPNASCGKVELLYRLLRPNSRQPPKGDIIDEGVEIDIKGNDIRLNHKKMTGKDYKVMTDNLFDTTKIQPNIVPSGKLKGNSAYEIEKKRHEPHFKKEFSKINSDERIELIDQYFKKIDIKGDTRCNAEKVFETGEYNRIKLVTIIIQDFMKNLDSYKWIIFGDGTNVKDLRTIDDLYKFEIEEDYFRINQPYKLGWYIK
jgi:hypothetical protein